MISLEAIRAAAARIEGAVERTPFLPSQTLSRLAGCELYLKFENLQFTASFKERGALNKLLLLSEAERRRGVIAMSAGNHAQAVAYHAARLHIPAVIVMPKGSPNTKIKNTQVHGATVLLEGESLADAARHADALAKRDDLVFVHPYEDPLVMAGQGTVGLEMLQALPELDALVVPVGGGGLLAGMAVAARERAPGVELIGVQAAGCPSMVSALAEGRRTVACETIADGIAVPTAGELTTEIVRELADDMLIVTETHLEEAISLYLDIEKVVAEGAGAASLAALLEHPDRFRGRRVGLVLSGGNIDPRQLASVIMRSLSRTGRLNHLVLEVDDLPGVLAKITAVIGRLGGNIVEVSHRRDLLELGLRDTRLDLVVETRDRAHLDEIVKGLQAEAFDVRIETPS